MPDGVRIGISSDYSGSGVSQAIGDLSKLESAGKGVSSQMVHAEGIMKSWSQAQYVASYNTERLASRASYLESQVKKGNLTVEEANKAFRTYAAEAKRGEWQAMSFGEKYRTVSGIVNTGTKQLLMGAAQFGALAAGIGYAGKQIYEFGKGGAVIEFTAEKFDRLARAAGSSGDIFLGQLRQATRGTVSDFGLLQQGANLLQLGLASDTKEAVRLSSVMTALGMDTGELTLALANQSKRRLDQLGLSLTKFNEIEARLKSSGMNKQDAFKEAFLQTAEQTVMTTGNMADSQLGEYLRMQAAGANVIDAAKVSMANNPLVSDAANILRAMNMVQRGEMAWGGNIAEIISGKTPALISNEQNLSQLAMAQWQRNNQASAPGRSNPLGVMPSAPSAAEFLYEDAATRRANAAAYIPTDGGGSGAATIDYAAMLSGGQDLTQMTQRFTEATADLNGKLAEESEKLADITKKYGEGSDEVLEQQEKIDGLKGSIVELNAQAGSAMDNFALKMLQSKGATEEMQFQFANAAGLVSDDAAKMYAAQSQLADAFMTGQLSADGYAAGVDSLQNTISAIDGKSVNTYIHVWVVQHGSTAYLGPNANTTTTNANIEALRGQTGGGRWTGGPLFEDKPTVVGDAPGGMWTPHTEVIWGGYVFNAEQSRALKESGVLDGAEYMAGGSAGNGPNRHSGRGRPRNGPNIPNGGRIHRGVSHPASANAAAQESESANAAAIAEQALQVSSQNVAQSQTVQNEIQQSSQQTVAAQQQTQVALVEKLDEVVAVLKRQPTKDDAFTAARAGQQTSI